MEKVFYAVQNGRLEPFSRGTANYTGCLSKREGHPEELTQG
jgi:hypothetical protein